MNRLPAPFRYESDYLVTGSIAGVEYTLTCCPTLRPATPWQLLQRDPGAAAAVIRGYFPDVDQALLAISPAHFPEAVQLALPL